MCRKCLRWVWSHRKLSLLLAVVAVFLAVNLITYNHAHSMTHFQAGGSRTRSPESLALWEKVQVLFAGVRIPRPENRADPGSHGLPFETCRFQGKDGIGLEAWRISHAHPKGLVLLLHGYAASRASLLAEARAFHDLGYVAVALDQRGSGGSDGNDTSVGVLEADDVAAVVESLQATNPDRPLILYGQSMGSVAILRAIAAHGIQPRAVIIECPFDRLLSTVENRFAALGVPAFPFAQLLVFWGGVQHGFNGFQHNPVDYARSVHCPVLLMQGDQDRRVTPEQARAIFDNLAGAKRLEVFPDVGHQSYLAARPELWSAAVSGFLAEHVR
jgi:alpha-beta hydrolase superfamily lysophospholipase